MIAPSEVSSIVVDSSTNLPPLFPDVHCPCGKHVFRQMEEMVEYVCPVCRTVLFTRTVKCGPKEQRSDSLETT